jgi:hypothetical protein
MPEVVEGFTVEDSPAVVAFTAEASPEVTPVPSDTEAGCEESEEEAVAGLKDLAAPPACVLALHRWATHTALGPRKDKASATLLPAGTASNDPPVQEEKGEEEKHPVAHSSPVLA